MWDSRIIIHQVKGPNQLGKNLDSTFEIVEYKLVYRNLNITPIGTECVIQLISIRYLEEKQTAIKQATTTLNIDSKHNNTLNVDNKKTMRNPLYNRFEHDTCTHKMCRLTSFYGILGCQNVSI